jgi:hypothetical protein
LITLQGVNLVLENLSTIQIGLDVDGAMLSECASAGKKGENKYQFFHMTLNLAYKGTAFF